MEREATPVTDQAGLTLLYYRILEKIGKGGMGVVHCGEDTRLGRQMAIKFLPDDLSADRAPIARFHREAHLLASLSHPSIAASIPEAPGGFHPYADGREPERPPQSDG